MNSILELVASQVAGMCELAAVAVLAFAAVEACVGVVMAAPQRTDMAPRKLVWVRFASWIMLALEFTLAADIVRTAITPSWSDIGQLAAIAAVRTVLNLFLARDVETYQRDQKQRRSEAAAGAGE